jgi:hypothetical protein
MANTRAAQSLGSSCELRSKRAQQLGPSFRPITRTQYGRRKIAPASLFALML